MGKSSKKSTTMVVDPAPPTKPAKKGKREAKGEDIEKQASAKKQKKDVIEVVQAIEKQKSDNKTQKKIKNEEETTSSCFQSEEEQKEAAVKALVLLKKPSVAAAKSETAKRGKLSNSSDDSDSKESYSEEDEKKVISLIPGKKLSETAGRNGSVEETSDSSDEKSTSDDEDGKPAKVLSQSKNLATANPKIHGGTQKNVNVVLSKRRTSDTSNATDSDEIKGKTAAATKKKVVSSDSSSSESEYEEEFSSTKAVPLKRLSLTTDTKQEVAGGKDDSTEESYDEEPQKKKMKGLPTDTPNAKPNSKVAQKECTNDEESSDEEPSKMQSMNKNTPVSKKIYSSEEETSDQADKDDTSEEVEEKPSETPKKKDDDREMAEVELVGPFSGKTAFQTPGTQVEASGSKTLFVGNLSFSLEQDDMENFFKDAGEIVDIRFAISPDGAFKGFGHVEFANVEAAQKALKLNGKSLLGRRVKLDFARERGSYTPRSSKESNSFQKGGGGQGQTVFIRGFDKSESEDKIRSALKWHFGSCGEISRISIRRDYDGGIKGIAYIDFKDDDGFNKALKLNGSEFGDNYLIVEEAKSRRDNRDGTDNGKICCQGGQDLLDRRVILDIATERGSYTPYSGKESNSFRTGGSGRGQKVFIRGFDKNDSEDKIRSALKEHFGCCGEVSRVSIPRDYDGGIKGIALIDFKDDDGFNKALELNGSEFGDNYLIVEEAKSRDDNRDAGNGKICCQGGQDLLGRRVVFATEKDSYSPHSGKEDNSYQKGRSGQWQKVFIRGFDKNDSEDRIRSALKEHFWSCGEISRVSIPKDYDGRIKGIAYIDFKDTNSFNKALELNGAKFGNNYLTVEEAKSRIDNREGAGSGKICCQGGQELLGRRAIHDIYTERGLYTPCGSRESNSFQKGGNGPGQKVFIRGFNRNDSEEKIRSALKEHFGSCGEISRISIPRDNYGCIKGIAYIDLRDDDGFNKALELNGSEFGDNYLIVEEAKSRVYNHDGAGSGKICCQGSQALLGRHAIIDFSRERGLYTPLSGNERNPFQKGGVGQWQKVFIRGFDKNDSEDKIRSAIKEHFGCCGEISRVSIPRDYDGG